MRFVSIVLLLVAVAMASAAGPKYDVSNTENARILFDQFIKDHNRQYKDDADEDVHFKAFIANVEKINKLSEQDSGATYGINKFADYTEEERKGMFGLRRNP